VPGVAHLGEERFNDRVGLVEHGFRQIRGQDAQVFVERRLDALFQSVQRPFDVDVVRGSGAQGVAPFTDGGSVVVAGFADLVDGGAFPFPGLFDVAVRPFRFAGEVGFPAFGRFQFQGALVEVVDEGFALGGGSVGVGEPVVEVGEPSPQRVYLESLHRGAFHGLLEPFKVDLGDAFPGGEGDPDRLGDFAEAGRVDAGGARGVAETEVKAAQSPDAAFDGGAVAVDAVVGLGFRGTGVFAGDPGGFGGADVGGYRGV